MYRFRKILDKWYSEEIKKYINVITGNEEIIILKKKMAYQYFQFRRRNTDKLY